MRGKNRNKRRLIRNERSRQGIHDALTDVFMLEVMKVHARLFKLLKDKKLMQDKKR